MTVAPKLIRGVQWIIAALALAPLTGHAFELVTEREAEASMHAQRQQADAAPAPRNKVRLRSLDLSQPRIEVLRPDLQRSDELRSPLPVEVRFHAKPGAKINRDSFRAYYGMFRIDVTQRLLAHAEITGDGIRVDDAELPEGSHRLLLRIEDDAQRVGERELRFVIAD